MNSSLVPANAKKSLLILGVLRPMPDLIILLGGILTTVLLLLLFQDAGTLILMLSCIPMLISLLLIMPIPNYHNTLCVIQSIIRFYEERKKGNYIWRGWCIYDEFKGNDK